MPTSPFLAPHRDDTAYTGWVTFGGTVQLDLPGVLWSNTVSASAHSANIDRYAPFIVEAPRRFDRLYAEVTSAATGGNTMRLGIFRAGRAWQPSGGPLVDSGTIASDSTGVKTYTPSSPFILQPGRYMTVVNASALVTLRAYRGACLDGVPIDPLITSGGYNTDWQVSRTYAAFPTPGTAWTGANAGTGLTNYCVFLRAA